MNKVKIIVRGRAIVSYEGEIVVNIPDEITDEEDVEEYIGDYVHGELSEKSLIQTPTTKFMDLESKQMEWDYAK